MKKFYFFLVALLVGVMSASADYYLIGGFNNWKLKDSNCLFTNNGDGTYVLDYNGQLTSGFKVNDGTWTNDNINFGSNGNKLSLGVPYTYSVSGQSTDISLAEGVVDNPHIVLDPTKKTLTITGQEADIEISYCIWGNMPEASSSWGAINLENTSGNIWVAEGVSVTATSDFGIKELTNGAQSAWIAADGTAKITASGVFNCKVGGDNFSIAAGTWDLTFDADAMTLKVASVGDTPVDPDPTPGAHNVYLAGEFNNYNIQDTYKFTEVENGVFTYSYSGTFTGNFKVVSDDKWLGTTTPVVSGVSYVLEDIAYDNMALASSAAENVVFTFTPATKTLVVTYTSSTVGPDPVVPDALYVLGDLKDNYWDPSNGVELTKEGSVFTGTINLDTAYENEHGYFSLCTALGAHSEDWNVGTRFGADEDGIVAKSGVAYDFVQAANPIAWKAAPAIYKISVDFEAKTMTLTWLSSGVDAIVEDADVAPVYYNLQGVRVAEPTNGLYIVVRGDKVAKQLVK